jgi:hypothetical protein
LSHIMLDLEMASVRPNGAILQLAAIEFDIKPRKVHRAFNVYVNNWETGGGHVCNDTLEWWKQQENYYKVMMSCRDSQYSEVNALDMFAEWLVEANARSEIKGLWGYPATSDLMWLECAYRRYDYRKLPWEYFWARDLHTLEKEIFHPEVTFQGVEHDAVNDALHQVRKVWEILDR